MLSNSSKSRRPFKPPQRTSTLGAVCQKVPPSCATSSSAASSTTDDHKCLKAKELELDEKIKNMKDKGYKPEQLQEYIDILHKYNETKDIAQMFLGRLAFYEAVTYKEIARLYNAPEPN